MSEIFLQILDQPRKAIFERLLAFKNKAHLAGGTALALQLNHRISWDFDLFLEKSLSSHFYKEVKKVFGANFETIRKSGNQISIKTLEGVKVDFVYYWYKLLIPGVKTSSLDLASLNDIAADKARTIGGRAQWRDYVDLFFLIKKHIFSLEQIAKMAKQKFGGEFNEILFLDQLTFFNDLQITEISFIKESYSEKEIKEFLVDQVKSYLKKQIPQIHSSS